MAVAHISTGGASALSATSVSVDRDTTAADHVNAFLVWRNDAQTISTFTREGAGMTQVGTDNTDANERVSIGGRRSASAGTSTDTFVGTLSGSSEAIRIIVTAMSGVDSGSPVASADTNENIGGSNSIATDATTVAAGNLALSCIVVRDDVSGSLADNGGASTTDRDAILAIGTGVITSHMVSFTSNLTVTWSWTEPGVGNWAKVMTVVYAAAAGGGGDTNARLLGGDLLHSQLFGRLVH